MSREDHEKKADELEHEADELEQQSAELGDQIKETDAEWKAKLQDRGVPGAQPSEEEIAAQADAGSHGPATGSADVEDEKS